MPREEFIKTEEEWIKGEISTMFYIGELQLYKNSLEARISELENEDRLGLDTDDKLRIQLEERLDCIIHESQMSLILEYIYDRISYKKLESSKTCENCEYENLDRYDDNYCQYEDICMRSFNDYYKAKEIK
jgi:hypothetical protein